MATQYEVFNEVTFEAYIKSAIDKSILKERLKKATMSQWEQSYTVLTDAVLYELSGEDVGINRAEQSGWVFQVQGVNVPIYNEKLGQVLSYLMPRDREIVLLYSFVGVETKAIANMMNIDPTTVRRHRKTAIQKMRDYLEAIA